MTQVKRSTPFTDSLRQARDMCLLEQTVGGMVVYPSFSDAPSRGSPRSSMGSASEGHPGQIVPCARQEFFERVGQEMVRGQGTLPAPPASP
jgi:hypothetical protein